MTDLMRAAQQALEALKGYRRELGDQQPCDAEQALEAALADQNRGWYTVDEINAKFAPDQVLKPEPPPEAQTEAEKIAYCAGWWAALEKARKAEPDSDSPERRCGGPGCDLKCCQPVQEPVAWRFEARHIDSAWAAAVTLKHPGPEGVYMRNVMPLYAHPPRPKPLTEEEKRALADKFLSCQPESYEVSGVFDLISAVERAHGIGGEE